MAIRAYLDPLTPRDHANFPELLADPRFGAAVSLEQALQAAREKERGWAEAEKGANRETLVTQATARQADFEAQLAALKAKGVPSSSAAYRFTKAEVREWQQRLKLLALLEAVDEFEARATATAALVAAALQFPAKVELGKLRPLLARLPEEFGARFAVLEADFKNAFPTASGTPGTPTATLALVERLRRRACRISSSSAHSEEAPVPDEPEVDAAYPVRDRGPSPVRSQDGKRAPGPSDGLGPVVATQDGSHPGTPPVGSAKKVESHPETVAPSRAGAARSHRWVIIVARALIISLGVMISSMFTGYTLLDKVTVFLVVVVAMELWLRSLRPRAAGARNGGWYRIAFWAWIVVAPVTVGFLIPSLFVPVFILVVMIAPVLDFLRDEFL
jgi:hypothetical protein